MSELKHQTKPTLPMSAAVRTSGYLDSASAKKVVSVQDKEGK